MSLFTGMEEWPVVKWGEMQLNDGKALDQRNIMCIYFTLFFGSIPVLEQWLQVSNTRRNSRIFRISFQDIKYVQCTFARNLLQQYSALVYSVYTWLKKLCCFKSISSQAAHVDAKPKSTLFMAAWWCLFIVFQVSFWVLSYNFQLCLSSMATLCRDIWCALRRWSYELIGKKTGNHDLFWKTPLQKGLMT